MSAWMTGLGMGMDLARQRASQDMQERAFAEQQRRALIDDSQQDRAFQFNQEQAGINNAQQDRAFAEQQQYRQFMREQSEREYADRTAQIARELDGKRATAAIFRAVSSPEIGPAPGGIGPVQQHPTAEITDDQIMAASPEGRRALFDYAGNKQAVAQRRADGAKQVAFARAAGQIKNVSDKQAAEWASLGFYEDGTIGPDEFPLSMRKQQEQQQEAVASILATDWNEDGEQVMDPNVYQQWKNAPPEMATKAFEAKRKYDASYVFWRQRGQDHNSAKAMAQYQAAGMTIPREMTTGPTPAQRFQQAKAMMTQAEREYRALSGQTGKTGTLVPPTKSEITAGDDIAAGKGHWFKTDATQERMRAKVEAWRKYQEAKAAVQGAYESSVVEGEAGAEAPGDPIDALIQEAMQSP